MSYANETGFSKIFSKVKTYVNSKISSAHTNILKDVYPVGSIYMSVNSTNPGNLFGGTWEQWGSGRVPVGINANDANFDTVEKIGGNKALSKHSHTGSTNTGQTSFMRIVGPAASGTPISYPGNHSPGINGSTGYIDVTDTTAFPAGNHFHSFTTGTTGTGTTNLETGNLQPYITCYMWKRTA